MAPRTSSFERLAEEAVDGSLRRLFRVRLHPVELAAPAAREVLKVALDAYRAEPR